MDPQYIVYIAPAFWGVHVCFGTWTLNPIDNKHASNFQTSVRIKDAYIREMHLRPGGLGLFDESAQTT